MKDIPRLLPLWLVLLLVALFATCGCRTGGVKLNPNSAGKIIQPKSPEQINKEAQAKREESEKFEQAESQKLKPAKIEPAKSQPVAPSSDPIKIEIKNKPTPPPASSPEVKFKPTVTDASSLTVKSDTKSTDTTLIPILLESKGTNWCGTIVTHEETPAKTNWLHLFSLFMILFTGALILWVAYDVIKDIFDMKKQGTPMKDHLDNLKKPAKGTRADRKKAVSKKAPKKKNPKKKD